MKNWIVDLASSDAHLEVVGGKGVSLARLARAAMPVPDGYHITTAAYRRFVGENGLQPRILALLEGIDGEDLKQLEEAGRAVRVLFADAVIPADIAEAITGAYGELGGDNPAVAVRSSATAEDLADASFAGQQETFLNVVGRQALLEAVRQCWASLWTPRAIGYRTRRGIEPGSVALAVVVQLMVAADAAGVMFTANPVNGRRDQLVISAAWGLGEAVVSGAVTPDRLVLERGSWTITEREIGDKRVRISAVDGGTAEVDVSAERRHAAVLSAGQAAELARLGEQIEMLYGMPMDIEWALAKDRIAILQARPITALPAPIPTEWKLPEGVYAAMRNNIVELMAAPLSPLFATFGLEAVNASMTRLMEAFFGGAGYLPEEPIITVNGYAYYNGSIRLRKLLPILANSVSIMRRMFSGAVERWTELGRPRYVATVNHWRTQPWQERSSADILVAARALTEAAVDAYGALVSGVIPAAWISEGLFSFVYRFTKRKDDPPAATFLLGFESVPLRAEKALHDLAMWAREQPALRQYLATSGAARLAADLIAAQPPENVDVTAWRIWRERFGEYLGQYGHMIYSLDFADPVAWDRPEPVLETFTLFVRGEGTNPHERQQASVERREAAVRQVEARLKGRRLRRFRNYLARAQKYAPLREDGLADVGLSYPLVRSMLLEIGRRLAAAGDLEEPGAIFWLTGEEVTEAANGEIHADEVAQCILARKEKWEAARKVVPPMMLPQIKIFGYDVMDLKTGARRKRGERLQGVAASPGRVTGTVRVIHGPEAFGMMQTGDVLVAPLTTPAWTPLFARAAAVVTDVGGPLSHGSIVAREYGIPAVLGTGRATRFLHSGQQVVVDGGAGTVTLLKAAANGREPV